MEEFYQVIDNWLEQSSHPNPAHPITVLDKALAEFYKAATTVIEVGAVLPDFSSVTPLSEQHQ